MVTALFRSDRAGKISRILRREWCGVVWCNAAQCDIVHSNVVQFCSVLCHSMVQCSILNVVQCSAVMSSAVFGCSTICAVVYSTVQ